MQKEVDALVREVLPLDRSAMTAAEEYQARLAKPPGSLGRLEEISIQLAGITGRVHNALNKKQLLVFAADNGVVAEGVSSAPQSVTKQQTINLMRGKTGAAVLAKHFGCGLTVCDVGVNADFYESTVLNRKIAYGTQNICTGPAMTREQTLQAILTGAEIARTVDADVIGVGEMGIGNTTTSSAVLAVLLGVDVEAVTGRGGGITEESFRKKKAVIRTAIEVNRPDRDDVVGVLSKVGGFDLAAMCGAFWARRRRAGRRSSTASFPPRRRCAPSGCARMCAATWCRATPRLRSATASRWRRWTCARCLTSACDWARGAAVRSPFRCSTLRALSSTTWRPLTRRASTTTIWTKFAGATSSRPERRERAWER